MNLDSTLLALLRDGSASDRSARLDAPAVVRFHLDCGAPAARAGWNLPDLESAIEELVLEAAPPRPSPSDFLDGRDEECPRDDETPAGEGR